MLPLSTIQQAIIQAQEASARLAKLLAGTQEPKRAELQKCLDDGAQASWLTQRGSPSTSPNALAAAVAKGWVESAKILHAHYGSLPAGKGKSMVAIALSENKATTPANFKKMVDFLAHAGYGFMDPAETKTPPLSLAFHRGLPFAQALLEAGALAKPVEPPTIMRVLQSSFSQPGGLELLLKHASPLHDAALAKVWWEVHMNLKEPNRTLYAQEGLRRVPPGAEHLRKISDDNPALRVELARQGLALPERLAEDEWSQGNEKLFWEVFSDRIPQYLAQGAPIPGLDLSTRDTAGNNWLMARIRYKDEVIPENYDLKGTAHKFAAVFPQAIELGLDPAAINDEGLTLGALIIRALHRANERQFKDNHAAWLDFVRTHALWAYPIKTKDAWEHMPDRPDLRAALGSLGVLGEAQADIERVQLRDKTPTPQKASKPTRI